MRVQVLYFAGARDLVGRAEETLDLPADVATIADFARFVAASHPPLAERMSAIRIAQNERFADPADPIADAATLALIPPVAGG
jgi:molybdopterin converting factor subunit 1